MMPKSIEKIQHPSYSRSLQDWEKWRSCYEGGDEFKSRYLKQLSSRETEEDFLRRKEIAPIPRFSGAAIDEIANSITVRFPDIKRTGGSKSYLQACVGEDGGVDRRGSNMAVFMAENVLPEMLVMRQALVYVDKEPLEEGMTKADTDGKRPYLYCYPIQDIMSWETYFKNGWISYKTILIRESFTIIDEESGLPEGSGTRYLRLWINKNGKVSAQYYMPVSTTVGTSAVPETYEAKPPVELNLTEIPIVEFSIKKSLMEDVADHQIALLNMESTDVSYAYGANFPFYTEQYGRQDSINHLKILDKETGLPVAAKEVVVGTTHGRRYPENLERPGFIHPSPEPLEISMKKQQQLKEDIRQLIGLSVRTLSPGHASAESKGVDNQTVEAGLTCIGLELQTGEQRIAKIWAEYQGDEPSSVIYPTNYTLVTEAQRQERAKNYADLQGKVPSKTFQKEASKDISRTLLEGKIPQETLEKILKEVDAADHITSNFEEIAKDLEMGLVSEETASNARGYDGKKEVPKARIEHAERAARILVAQTAAAGKAGDSGSDGTDPQARGSKDLSADPDAGKKEKESSQSGTLNPDRSKKVRS